MGFNKFNNDKLTKMNHAQDFRHINIDTYYSKKYYLET